MAEFEKQIKEITERAKRFFRGEERLLADYAQATGLRIEQGDKWMFDIESGKVYYDPDFFTEKGKVCDEVSQLPETLAELLKEFTKDL